VLLPVSRRLGALRLHRLPRDGNLFGRWQRRVRDLLQEPVRGNPRQGHPQTDLGGEERRMPSLRQVRYSLQTEQLDDVGANQCASQLHLRPLPGRFPRDSHQ